MKTKAVQLAICFAKVLLRVIYFFLKLMPVNHDKMVFCSRQSNDMPLDFELIYTELMIRRPQTKCVFICKHIGDGVMEYVRYAKALFRSMYHLATSRLCIIDSYWPAVSMLAHKKHLKVIQLWHSIGKVKKSGYQTIGKKSGRKTEYAKLLHMHENYDYVVAGAEIWNQYYCESFHITEDKILNYGLPRIDYLLKTESQNRERFFREHSAWRDKKIVLYAPTFRRNMESQSRRMLDAARCEDFILLVKKHPGQLFTGYEEDGNIVMLDTWKAIDLLSVCDILITDYSAIAIEAAVLKKTTYYWVYDYTHYIENNGLNIDLYGLFPGYVYEDADELFAAVRNDLAGKECDGSKCSADKVSGTYAREYLPEQLDYATNRITGLIKDLLNERKSEDSVCESLSWQTEGEADGKTI